MQGALQCAWTDLDKELSLNLLDQSGKILRNQVLSNEQGQFTWIGLSPGMYFIQYADQQGASQSRQVLVF
jgi:hypothetical protein